MVAWAGLTLAAATPLQAGSAARDPLVPLIHRMNRYFEGHTLDGVTLDSRYDINPSETIRMSVVCQLLGYTELYKTHASRRFRRHIVEHADYLIPRLTDISSGTPFDGMLCYSLLAAYGATGESRFLDSGRLMVNELEAIPTSECVLNGGLMVVMAMAEYARLTGDLAADQKARDILTLLPPYQHTDGSFPHWCVCSKDIHYTGWMAQELVLIGRTMNDPRIEPILAKMREFMEERIDSSGHSHYEEPCPGVPGCFEFFDSRRSGCGIDYDTRAWTVEPGYSALLLDHFRSPKYQAVMDRLVSLENRGTFADKWDFIPTPDDPEYPWSIADTSVANMSIIFWTLGTILSGRRDATPTELAWDDERWSGPEKDPEAETEVRIPRPVAQPLALSGGRARRWRTVDRLFLAGVEGATYCDGPRVGGATGKLDERLGQGKRGPGTGASGTGAGSEPSIGWRLEPPGSNPAGAGCEIRFNLPAPARVSLAIYDAGGRLVRELLSESLEAGDPLGRWDRRDRTGSESRSGLYFVRLRAGAQIRAARILVLR